MYIKGSGIAAMSIYGYCNLSGIPLYDYAFAHAQCQCKRTDPYARGARATNVRPKLLEKGHLGID